MGPSRFHILFIILVPAFLLAGCGTRTIIVPIQRPAAIDLHNCGRVAVTLGELPIADDEMTPLVRSALGDLLVPSLNERGVAEFIEVPAPEDSPLITSRGTISLPAASSIAQVANTRCVLYCTVLDGTYSEDVLAAETRSNTEPQASKRVRKGKAGAMFGVLAVDVQRSQVTFSDTLHLNTSSESRAIDEEPPPLDHEMMAQKLASMFAAVLSEAIVPVRDQEVVTFLLDGTWPEIEQAVALAEAGQWSMAGDILDSAIASANVQENRDILWYDLGLVKQYQNDFRGAKEAFERALALNDRSRYRHAIEALLRMEDEYLESARQKY